MSVQEDTVSSTPDHCVSGGAAGDTTNDEELYQVEQILAKKIENGEVFYLIKWQGFEGQDTWEPEKHVSDCPDLIKDFEERVRADLGLQGENMEEDDKDTRGQFDSSSSSSGSGSDQDLSDDDDGASSSSSPPPISGFERGLEPQKILGVANCDGEICFLMQWKGEDVSDIVPRLEANEKCPQIVIKFYQDRILWTTRTLKENGEDEEEEKEKADETSNPMDNELPLD